MSLTFEDEDEMGTHFNVGEAARGITCLRDLARSAE